MDERGFIAEDEEATCGLQADQRWAASHNLSLGVEGGNGALVAIGPVPGFASIVRITSRNVTPVEYFASIGTTCLEHLELTGIILSRDMACNFIN